jgi:putative acetyltransferase
MQRMSTPDCTLRPAAPADLPVLAALYADTARRLGPQCYTPEQVEAWVRFGAVTPAFHDYVLGATSWVLQSAAGELLGFSGVDDAGEVRSFYIRADHTRQGLGSRLLRHVLADAQARGLARFTAWATPFSLPVFRREGFALERVVREPFEGVLFDRYRVGRG